MAGTVSDWVSWGGHPGSNIPAELPQGIPNKALVYNLTEYMADKEVKMSIVLSQDAFILILPTTKSNNE